MNRNFLTSIKVFSNLIESRGGQMAGHGRRVADLARKLAREINLDASQTRDVFVAGLLHDIGSIGLPDAVLAMPVARLRPEELAAYCEHPVLGEQALMPLVDLQPVAAIIRSHHERYDGRGYPDRLGGTEIPIGARILAVVDAYDDLQSGHVTAAMATIEEARTLLRKGRSSQFDPEVLDVFLQMTEPERRQQRPELRIGSDALEPDMILARDLVSREGVMLLAAGQGMTPAVIQRIRAFERRREETFVLSIRPHRAVAQAVATIGAST